MVIGSNERSESVDVPFDHFGQKHLTISVKNTRPEVVKLAKISKNSGFSRLKIVRARTFEQKVIETSEILEKDFGGVGACSCSLNTCYAEDIGL